MKWIAKLSSVHLCEVYRSKVGLFLEIDSLFKFINKANVNISLSGEDVFLVNAKYQQDVKNRLKGKIIKRRTGS